LADSLKPIFWVKHFIVRHHYVLAISFAKASIAAKSPELKVLTQASLNVKGVPNGPREAILNFFKNGGVWEVRAQLTPILNTCRFENTSITSMRDCSYDIARPGGRCGETWKRSIRGGPARCVMLCERRADRELDLVEQHQ
jgi:hypothetical protein